MLNDLSYSTLVQIGKHRLKQTNKNTVNKKHLAYQGFFFYLAPSSDKIKDELVLFDDTNKYSIR